MGNKNYYLGLDIGTNSVGYAVVDEKYNLIKYGGEPMWGSHIFEEAKQSAERRQFRAARRRGDRKKQRVALIGEIFASEIAKVDDRFFIRRQESGLYREETTDGDKYIVFNEDDYNDRNFYSVYPTIHHLIHELMVSDKPHDVRLVYLACAYLVAHRGHFLSEVSKDNVEDVLNFDIVYNSFIDTYQSIYNEIPWECDTVRFQEILLKKVTVTKKEQMFLELLNGGKKYKIADDDISKEGIIKLLSGGTYDLGKMFPKIEFEEKVSVSFKKSEEEFLAVLEILDEDANILAVLRNLYDWAILAESLKGDTSISKSKIEIYEQHKKDLIYLKGFIKKYLPNKYYEVFRSGRESANYVSYSYNYNSVKDSDRKINKATKYEFCDYIEKLVKDVEVPEEEKEDYEDMMLRLSMDSFMPKQVDGDNRVIPYQLYYNELKTILTRAKKYLPFLDVKDNDGYTPIEKILSVMTFRVPYYVGPLRTDNGEHGWMIRKAEGKIYPWNFEDMVDLDKSEQAFIKRMTNTCSYIPNEKVLPKASLLYCKFNVLNEINNIKINGADIPVADKQEIYHLFQKNKKVTIKLIKEYLKANNLFHEGDILSGIDISIKSSLKSYHDFKRLIENRVFTEEQVEEIIEHITFSEDKKRIERWIRNTYPSLQQEDIKYISHLKYKDFGRLSGTLLCGIKGCNKDTGEVSTIIKTLWETNDNLMKILSDRYTFGEEIERLRKEYYAVHTTTVETILKDMYISNAVKRPIYRTLDIVKDVRKACKCDPQKIFVEMARGEGEKGKRTKSRREQIEDLYKNMDMEEVREISKQLEGKSDNELQSEVLFLYFMQLGKCAYTGESIDIGQLKTNKYNVDHIYPQAYVKDDSIHNKVLVLSEENGKKGDKYPIRQAVRNKMSPYWRMLKNNNLISDEKYKRLTRNTPFSDEERMGFINRQLVETRQSTKAVAAILKAHFPKAEIVYSRAGLVSDFRKEFNMLKCRSVNDLHHAKDAYLNVVVGNVYHCRFTKNFFLEQKYTLKTKQLFAHPVNCGDKIIWQGEEDVAKVKKIMKKNNIHYSRYAFIRKGGLFDQMPLKAAEGLVPRKEGLDPVKYGGYNKATAAGFILVKYKEKGKTEACIMPVDLMSYYKAFSSLENAICYSTKTLETIWNKKGLITDIEFPIGLRLLKVNTMLSFDGFRACITGKSNGGQAIGLTSMMPLLIGDKWEAYVKKIERFEEKRAKNKLITLNEEYDGISKESNVELYNLLSNKVINELYESAFGALKEVLDSGKNEFKKLVGEEQVKLLSTLVLLLKSGRAGSCDLTVIGGKGATGVYKIGTKLSVWKKKFTSVRLVDMSASGIYESVSGNLLDFI